MAQHDYVIANASGATVRADINSALSAIQTLNSGTSEPSSTAAGMLWLDTTGGAPYVLKIRDAGNNHWITITSVNDPGSDSNAFLPAQINLPSTGGVYESDGSTEILTESSGTVSLKNTTIDSTSTFPKGVSRGVNYLQQVQTSGNTSGGLLGGTGIQVVPFNTIKAGTEDSAFTQDILSLSSNIWTMRTGYYLWDFIRPTYHANHAWVFGIQTYGDNTGSGTTIGYETTDNVNFGSMFYYTNSGSPHAIPMIHTGVLKVTHTAQQYIIRMSVEANNQHAQTTYTHSSTFKNIQHFIRFIRIGDV